MCVRELNDIINELRIPKRWESCFSFLNLQGRYMSNSTRYTQIKTIRSERRHINA